ncbi:MAG: phosphate ABC transporter permease subunit PstC [Hyphomonadaceae bacterium]|nr:phosphate ABC transporter permease subunit PstC [Hyphomonadaceae bacterium]
MATPITRDFTVKRPRYGERLIEGALFLSAAAAVFITIAIVFTLLKESAIFFSRVSVIDFLTDTVWSPLFQNPRYGIAPLLAGTFLTTLVALSFAVPVGLVAAIYLSEFASPRTRETVKPVLELLAAVPTVIYGYFALTLVTPFLRATILPDLPTFNMLSAGLVIGILIVPYIASLSEDAMRAVPASLREGSLAMGATRLETSMNVVLPAAISGISGALVLGMSRAVGETMIVAIAGGQQPNFTFDPTESAATVTAYIAQVAIGDVAVGTIEYYSIFAAGFALLAVTLAFNLIAFWLQRRYREAY